MGNAVKIFLGYDDQLELLASRGMEVGDRPSALALLERVNYYRLSGYWYPFRARSPAGRRDTFIPGTNLHDIVQLYEFDARLRSATFSVLAPIELAMRSLLGHELGRIDPAAHLDHALLGPTARDGSAPSRQYQQWRLRYEQEIAQSREEFVAHHLSAYGGSLPIWAAVETLDWGSLTALFGFSPRDTQDAVARTCGLRGPQLASWLKCLNILRNVCAHHGRLFNRVYALTPRLPTVGLHRDLDEATTQWSRTFGQLTLVQFLLDRLGVGNPRMLPAVLRGYQKVAAVPISHLGAPIDWSSRIALWRATPL